MLNNEEKVTTSRRFMESLLRSLNSETTLRRASVTVSESNSEVTQ